jgi:hypothetical protein
VEIAGSTSALREIYAYLDGGHRTKMERYILHLLHILFNGMNKNNELLLQRFKRTEAEAYINAQYGLSQRRKVVENVCDVLQRFDNELDGNLKRDFGTHYDNFEFLSSKYDWLHLHWTTNHQVCDEYNSFMYFSTDFVPQVFKKTGEYCYWLHYIPKHIWVDPSEEEISSARAALREANRDFTPGAKRHVLMAKRLNQRNLAWWGTFYGNRGSPQFKFSDGLTKNCSVAEWLDPHEWRVLICGYEDD